MNTKKYNEKMKEAIRRRATEKREKERIKFDPWYQPTQEMAQEG